MWDNPRIGGLTNQAYSPGGSSQHWGNHPQMAELFQVLSEKSNGLPAISTVRIAIWGIYIYVYIYIYVFNYIYIDDYIYICNFQTHAGD